MRAAAAARLLAPRLFRRAPATASLVSSQSLPFCSLPIQSPLVHSPPPPPCSYSLQLHSPPCYASLARSNLAHTSNHASLFALGSLLFLGGGAQLDDGSAHCEGDNSGTSQCAASRHNLHGATSPKHADAMDTPPFPTPSDIMATFARMKDDAKAEGTRNKGRKRKLKSTVSKSPVEEVAVKIPTQDIIFGQGNVSTGNLGNASFRHLTDNLKGEYESVKEPQLKKLLLTSIIDGIRGSGRKFVMEDTKTLKWYEADNSLVRNKVGQRLRSSLNSSAQIIEIPIASTPPTATSKNEKVGVMKSFVYHNFLSDNLHLLGPLKSVLGDVCMHGSHHPDTPGLGGLGLCLSADSPQSNPERINLHRPSYARQNYGKSVEDMETNNPKTEYRYTYGTGSGVSRGKGGSHGTIPSHTVTREFTPAMVTIAQAIEKHLNDHCLPDTMDRVDVSQPLNSCVIGLYYGKKEIRQHSDQRYDELGNFLYPENSQQRHTLTCILAIGDTRQLKFNLMRRKRKGEDASKSNVKIDGTTQTVDLSHGTLFFLHPDDELPQIRAMIHAHNLTYYMHEGKGVGKSGDDLAMSIGLVFRVCCHYRVVNKDTGLHVLTVKEMAEDKSKKYQANHKKLKEYLGNTKLKESTDSRISACYQRIENEYLTIKD